MKKIILIFCCLSIFAGYAQKREVERPDYTKIEKQITKKRSNLYYPTLLERFNNSDSTMTLEEKRHLYYGFIYQDNYSPYGNSKYSDSIKVIFDKEELDISDYEKIIVFSNTILKENPFDLRALNYGLYCDDFLQNHTQVGKTIIKFRMIMDAILSSGTGRDAKDPIYVTLVPHEYVILDILGYQFGGSQSLIGTCDYIKIGDNDDQIEGLYFEISPSLNYLNNMFK